MTEEAKEVLEPEVLPPLGSASTRRDPFRAWQRSFGPVLLGVLIDLVDLATFGPLGLRAGFLFGAAAAYVMCGMYRLPLKPRLLISLAAGMYCMVPGTSFIPLGTLLGTLSALKR